MTPRATPLPPDERRAQILAVSEPLVLEHGSRVTTRQIADAAGVAEGTLFRIFATKTDLLHAVVVAALDPTPTIEALRRIDLSADLETRLQQAIEALRSQVQRVTGVMTAMRDLANEHHGPPGQMKQAFGERNETLNQAVAAVLAPDADRLRLPVDEAAAWIRTTILIAGHPMLRPAALSTADALADVLLHGIHRDPAVDDSDISQPAKES